MNSFYAVTNASFAQEGNAYGCRITLLQNSNQPRWIQLRGDNTFEDAEKRISIASVEISEAQQYDYVLVNYDVDAVVKEIVSIITV